MSYSVGGGGRGGRGGMEHFLPGSGDDYAYYNRGGWGITFLRGGGLF